MATVTIIVSGESPEQRRSTRRIALFCVLFGLILGCVATGCLWWAIAVPAKKEEPKQRPPRPQLYSEGSPPTQAPVKLPPRVRPVFRSNPLPPPS